MNNILFIFNSKKDNDLFYTNKIINYLKNKNVNVYSENNQLADELGIKLIDNISINNIDLTIILGGDGTILKYARNYGKYQIPVLGINIGRVGALAHAEADNFEEYLDKYFLNEYSVTENLTLKGKITYKDGKIEEFIFYNDLILHRGLSLKLLPIDISINDSNFSRIYADGVVVSTPLGSSAYNLSAGGAIISQNCNCYALTPICSQTRSFSSSIISDSDKLTIVVKDTLEEEMVSIDGCDRFFIHENDKIEITKSDIRLKIIQFVKQASLYEAVYKVIDSIHKGGR